MYTHTYICTHMYSKAIPIFRVILLSTELVVTHCFFIVIGCISLLFYLLKFSSVTSLSVSFSSFSLFYPLVTPLGGYIIYGFNFHVI